METSVLGVRLNREQWDSLNRIAVANRMKEVEVARLLIDSAIAGKIKIEKGKVVTLED